MDVKELVKDVKEYVIDLRREFHMNPEPSWEEIRTSKRVMEELDKMGILHISVAGTGVVAVIKGSQEGKTVALRADMDALRINESNDVPYRSKNPGVMHACGHDGHTAMLLGAAKILNDHKDEIKGTIKLFFQPAEETALGAGKLIVEGIMEGVDGIFGIHLWAGLPVGKVSVEAGPRMASADIFKIRVKGSGGHGSMPHQAVDAIVTASAMVMELQSIVSREISPLETAVVSVGIFKSGTGFNIIASEAYLEGTTRSFDPSIRESLPNRIERIAKNTASSHRAEAELEYITGTPPVINDESCAAIAQESMRKLFGDESIIEMEKVMGAEDFAMYLEMVPGMMAFVGAQNQEIGACYPHHNERFNIDEESLEIGTALYTQYALDFLNK